MAVPYTGRVGGSTNIFGAIRKQLELMSLKPVKSITVQFDPFSENTKETREFAHIISARKVQIKNLDCALKTNIVCDRSEPTVTYDLINGEKVLFKCNNLTILELLTLYNKHITVLAPPEPEPEVKGVVIRLKKQKTRKRISKHRR